MLSLLKKLHTSATTKGFLTTSLIISLFLPLQDLCAQQDVSSSETSQVDSKFEIGASGGFTLNRFTRGQPQTGFNTGYTAGVLLSYKVSKQFNLQIEANFLQQGGQLISFKDDTRIGLPESFLTKNTKNSSVKLNSVELPLLIKYVINVNQTWRPALYFGGSYVYSYEAIDNYQKTGNLLPGEDLISTVDDLQNVTSLYNTNRANLVFGADLHLPLFNKIKLLLDFRYLNGLTPARQHYSYMEKIGFGSDVRSNSFVTKLGLVMPVR